eukprot:jgi/Tetstr1/433700/TSEL_022919.t1
MPRASVAFTVVVAAVVNRGVAFHNPRDNAFGVAVGVQETKAYKYLRGAYKEDFAPPLELAEGAPAAPISKGIAFNAAPIKKAKLPGVAGVILLMRTVEQHDDNDPPAQSPAEALAVQMKEVEDDLKLTLVSPINDDGTNFDLLAWWKAKQSIFPRLRKMARLYHAFPATSAGVERLFSAAGRMHNHFKKSTSDTTLEHSLLVYKNLE